MTGSEDLVAVVETWKKELEKRQPELKVQFEVAAPGDAAARKADTRAMNALFAGLHFEEAKQVLKSALSDCGGCSRTRSTSQRSVL